MSKTVDAHLEAPNDGRILNVRKPIGWTSNDVVRRAKRLIHGGKVGHAGTLDPFADGVLLLCFGRAATRQVPQLMALEKEYRLVLQMGVATDTLDVSGVVIERRPMQPLSQVRIEQALRRFVGEIEQTPPVYSAVHIEGRRAYDLARRGEAFELQKRCVRIHRLALIDFNADRLTLEAVCSKGVYVRSLARDIAEALGEIGYLKKLTRTRIGPYDIRASFAVTELEKLLTL